MITLCIPTLNRYELLQKCLQSAEEGTVVPDRYLIIDNGLNLDLVFPKTEIIKFGENVGVAKAWNYFIRNTEEIRIISNDDISFFPDTIEKLVNGYRKEGLTCTNMEKASSFSLYIMSDFLVDKVGFFDEEISPNYAYYEDNDFHYRMMLQGYQLNPVWDCEVGHFKSATLKSFNSIEQRDHHRKFSLAADNYKKKWGGQPGKEIYVRPYNKE